MWHIKYSYFIPWKTAIQGWIHCRFHQHSKLPATFLLSGRVCSWPAQLHYYILLARGCTEAELLCLSAWDQVSSDKNNSNLCQRTKLWKLLKTYSSDVLSSYITSILAILWDFSSPVLQISEVKLLNSEHFCELNLHIFSGLSVPNWWRKLWGGLPKIYC